MFSRLKPILLFVAGGSVVGGIALVLNLTDGHFFEGKNREPSTASLQDFGQEKTEIPFDSSITSPSDIGESADRLDLARLKTDFSGLAAFYSVLVVLDEVEIVSLLNQTDDLSPGNRREIIRTALLRRYAEISPKRSLDHARQFPRLEQEPFVYGIFQEWSRLDLVESIDAASQLPPVLRTVALDAILNAQEDLDLPERREIAKRIVGEFEAVGTITRQTIRSTVEDPREAWNMILLDEFADTRQLEMLTWVAEMWVEKDGIGAIRDISASFFLDMSSRMNVLSSVLRSTTLANPQIAFDNALSMQGQLGDWVTSTVVQSWATFDPGAALSAVNSIDSSLQQQNLFRVLANSWASSDPRSALAQLDVLPESVRASTEEMALLSLGRVDARHALDLISSFKEERKKFNLTYEVVSDWAKRDMDSALNWVLSNESIHDPRSRLIAEVVRILVHQDPQKAMDIALRQPVREGKSGLEVSVIGQLSRTDIETGIRLLPLVRAESKADAYVVMGHAFVRNYEPDRAVHLGLQLDQEGQQEYFNLLLESWAQVSPDSLFRLLEEIPIADVRSRAALLLAHTHQDQQVLSEKELESLKSYLNDSDFELVQQLERDLAE